MRVTIGIKIFGIAVGLLILMAVVALLSMRMTRTVDDQLVILDHNYFPAYVALAQANISSVEESAYARRLLLASAERSDNTAKVDDLRQRVANAGKASDEQIAAARQHINEQIADPLDFDDNIALARLDVRIEALQEERQRYEAVLGKLLAAADADNKVLATELLAELDDWRDDFDRKIDAARSEMRRLAGAAIVGTRAYQRHVVQIGLALLAIAALLGIIVAGAVTLGLVRPVRRLLAGTAAVEGGALDTVVPITSRDEIGRLTQSFNSMVGELRIKAQIRETFGKYVDPRIVALRAPASALSRTQISAAISQLEARIRQLYALPVQSISSGDDRKVLSLSHAIEATLDRIYGAGTHQYGLLSKAKDLDATEYLTHFLHNQPPSAHEIRNGIERGRQRAIALLTQEVALMKEQLGDEDCLANRAVRAYSNLDLHPEIARAVTDLRQALVAYDLSVCIL
jgi:HAMP domain-containing protein